MKPISVQPPELSEPRTYLDLALRTFSTACGAKLEALKRRLIWRFTSEFSDLQDALVRQAVEDAHALASLTTVPFLFLPVLAEEKVRSTRDWAQRQQAIRHRSMWALLD